MEEGARNGRRTALKRSEIERLIDASRSMPKKADVKDELNVQELIPKLWPALSQLLGKGYSYRDVALWLIKEGVSASEETLNRAIGDEARQRRRKVRSSVVPDAVSPGADHGDASAPATPAVAVPAKHPVRDAEPIPSPSPSRPRSSPAFSEEV